MVPSLRRPHYLDEHHNKLNLSCPLIRACETLGYTKPTPIQAACIPLALTGSDICGSAVTGSGKGSQDDRETCSVY
ncbi:DEAD-box ATP-dependent RNA helicase 28-like [Hibiscus syriacus]|uniref:DEAD-box ATP-dependent RNA helicase 28-like n=1 Tax=Hibiscus syriacus TaxID=106335 RepID=UPI0019220F53|nr:DEAD-box ATP-dependent RNA helicase 28-like [Hibiscus syriacus]